MGGEAVTGVLRHALYLVPGFTQQTLEQIAVIESSSARITFAKDK